MWDKTVVCIHLFDALRNGDGVVSEHDLIRYLDSHQCFAAFAEEPANLRLFRKHFIARHCLYHLQEVISAEWRLDIGMMNIELHKLDGADPQASQMSVLDRSLREYYLDLAHLEKADVDSVETLLRDFWQRFAAADKSADAFAALDIDSSASWTEIQQAYRRKVQKAHPDQGGTPAEFAAVQEAYEILRQRFGKRR